mgnify:FL=1
MEMVLIGFPNSAKGSGCARFEFDGSCFNTDLSLLLIVGWGVGLQKVMNHENSGIEQDIFGA